MVEMQKISTHGKTSKGNASQEGYARTTNKGHGMYVFKYKDGKTWKSTTKHCSEEQAKRFKDSLE